MPQAGYIGAFNLLGYLVGAPAHPIRAGRDLDAEDLLAVSLPAQGPVCRISASSDSLSGAFWSVSRLP